MNHRTGFKSRVNLNRTSFWYTERSILTINILSLSKFSHSICGVARQKGSWATPTKVLRSSVAQSCPILSDPIDGSPLGSPVPGILQARTLEWVAISSNTWKWKVKVKLLSFVWLLVTSWTAAYQAPPSMGFSRQEYWSGVPLPSPSVNGEDLSNFGPSINV